MDKYDIELFNDIYREISTIVGTEATLKLYNMYKGQQITFPVHIYKSELLKNALVSEYDGTNIRELARKYEYSEKTLRRIINKKQVK